MKKINYKLLVSSIFLVLIIFGVIVYKYASLDRLAIEPNLIIASTSTATVVTANVKNIAYIINGETFTLINGSASTRVSPDSGTVNTLTLFGEPTYGDLNGDSVIDAAVLLVNNPGGSGAFYYAVLAISKNGVFQATNALLLGDRIAPQSINIEDSRAVFSYAERKRGEPMSTPPSVGKSLHIHYNKADGTIGEFVKNFEGEADTDKMTLGMKKWEWVKTQMNDGTITTPKKSKVFTLTFLKDGRVTIGTDCNTMSGSYTLAQKKLTIDKVISTRMYCEGSQEQNFAGALGQVRSYLFTSKGELILEIKMDSGTMIFR